MRLGITVVRNPAWRREGKVWIAPDGWRTTAPAGSEREMLSWMRDATERLGGGRTTKLSYIVRRR